MNQPVDPQTYAELQELMEDSLQDFIDTYLENTPLLIEKIVVGLAAEDPQAVFHSAHQLKGGSGSMGAVQLAEYAYQIEQLGKSGSIDGVAELLAKLQAEFQAVSDFLNQQS